MIGPVYSATTVTADVGGLSAAVHSAVDQASLSGSGGKLKFPAWFSGTLKYSIKKNNYFYRRFKKGNYSYWV
jgi:hypothetical protein